MEHIAVADEHFAGHSGGGFGASEGEAGGRFRHAPMLAPKRFALKKYFANFRKSLANSNFRPMFFPVDTPQTSNFRPMFFPVGTL